MAAEQNVDPLKEGLPQNAFAKATDQVRIRTDRFRQLYANNMTIGLNTWDVAITFGEIAGEQDGKTVIEETVKISMTREIAKVLATLLNNHIGIFEEKFWEIKLPVVEAVVKTSEDDKTEADKLRELEASVIKPLGEKDKKHK